MAPNPAAAQTEPEAGGHGAPRVAVPAPKDERYAHLAWPKVAEAPDGTLALAYVAARKHANGDGCPAVSISMDGGRSFSPPEILREFDGTKDYQHCGNLALGLAPDGAVVLLAMAFTDNKRNSIFGWRSTDSGRSWESVDTSSLGSSRTGSVFGHVFAVQGGRLAVCGHYRRPKGTGIWIAYSRDDGKTWGPPRTIAQKEYYEPCFIHTAGRLIGLVRENRAKAYHQFVSDDLGETWQEAERAVAGAAACHPSPCIAADPNDPSRIYCLQSQRTKRGEIYLWSSDAKELAWQKHGLVVSFEGCQDYTYPWMTHLRDDEWFVVFYAGKTSGANSIYCLSLRTPGLVETQ